MLSTLAAEHEPHPDRDRRPRRCRPTPRQVSGEPLAGAVARAPPGPDRGRRGQARRCGDNRGIEPGQTGSELRAAPARAAAGAAAGGGASARRRVRGRAPARARQARRPGGPSGAGPCARHPGQRLARPLRRQPVRHRRGAAAGHRPPAGQGRERPAGRGQARSRARRARGAVQRASHRAGVSGDRVGRAATPERLGRPADRAPSQGPQTHGGGRGRQAGAHPLPRAGGVRHARGASGPGAGDRADPPDPRASRRARAGHHRRSGVSAAPASADRRGAAAPSRRLRADRAARVSARLRASGNRRMVQLRTAAAALFGPSRRATARRGCMFILN